MIPSVAEAEKAVSAAKEALDRAEQQALTTGDLKAIDKAAAEKSRADVVLRLATRAAEEERSREVAAYKAGLATELEALRPIVCAAPFVAAIRGYLEAIADAEGQIQTAAREIGAALTAHNANARRAITIGQTLGVHVEARELPDSWPAHLAGVLVADRFEHPIGSRWLEPKTRPDWHDEQATYDEARALLAGSD